MTNKDVLHNMNNIIFSIVLDADLLQQIAMNHLSQEEKLKRIFIKISDLERHIDQMKKLF